MRKMIVRKRENHHKMIVILDRNKSFKLSWQDYKDDLDPNLT